MRTPIVSVFLSLALAACGSDYTEGVSRAEVEEVPAEAPPETTADDEGGESAEASPEAPGQAEDDGVPEGLERLTLDAGTSTLGYTGAKLTGSHDGSFPDFTGTIDLDADTVENSRVTIEINTTTLEADRERLTTHLRSPDFFDVEQFPTASFRSTGLEAGGEDGATHQVTGNLELHGQTHQIRFPATITVSDAEVRAQAQFVIDRTTWGISYPGRAEDLIRNEVVIRFDVRARRSADGA